VFAPGRPALSRAGLRDCAAGISASLRALDITGSDRVAVVLPWGPELVVAYLGVTQVAVFAPLNPAYTDSEFGFYLADLDTRMLITSSECGGVAAGVAARLGIPVHYLEARPDEAAGCHSFTGPDAGDLAAVDLAGPQDVALVLHTSGTTAKPKQVPLTHRNLCTSAHNIARTLALGENDCSLVVMPLFHIHALVSSTLAPMVTGGRVVAPPGFLAPRMLDWFDEFRPTWYTCSPTIHQAILERVRKQPERIMGHSLRFLRTGAAAMPPRLHRDLEETFGVPVIEFLGMTEAAQQITSNQLPPGRRKVGSVGVPAGPEVAIMSQDGVLLPSGQSGEIVIRGDNVTAGYAGSREANEKAFHDGWFRTGDEGHFDPDGFLYLTGRLKEMINRGGEKVWPREVDEVLLEHPAVFQIVTFSIPHAQLGEVVGAAIVLQKGAEASEVEIQRFAAERLSDFKVPRVIVFLDSIPCGPTGKLQRVGLARRLGIPPIDEMTIHGDHDYVAPRTPLERRLQKIWQDILGLERVGVDDHFLAMGGDSMLATRLANQVSWEFDKTVTVRTLFEAATIREMAAMLDAGADHGE
jgi:oxalate---CoA ligase